MHRQQGKILPGLPDHGTSSARWATKPKDGKPSRRGDEKDALKAENLRLARELEELKKKLGARLGTNVWTQMITRARARHRKEPWKQKLRGYRPVFLASEP
eukprot:878879-Rhodomonas_salina.1